MGKKYFSIPDSEQLERDIADLDFGVSCFSESLCSETVDNDETESYQTDVLPTVKKGRVEKKKVSPFLELAQKVVEEFSVVSCNGRVFVYDMQRGFYRNHCCQSGAANDFSVFLRKNYPEMTQTFDSRKFREVYDSVLREPSVQKTAQFFSESRETINCANGTVLVVNGKAVLNPHSKEKGFSYSISARYLSNEKLFHPCFDRWCESSLEGDKEKIELLFQVIGYALSDSTAAKKFFLFVGQKDCGKSVLQNFLMRLLSGEYEENEGVIFNAPLEKLGTEFTRAKLLGCKLLVPPDVSSKPIRVVDTMKALTGNDRISAAFKGKDEFSFRPNVKVLLSANTMPSIEEFDANGSFVDRMIPLLFNRQIPQEEQNPHLSEELWAERDAIFTEACNAFARLVRDNFRFTLPWESKEFLNGFRYADAVASFLADEIIVTGNEGDYEFKAYLFDRFQTYCRENGLAGNVNNLATTLRQQKGVTEHRRLHRCDRHTGKSENKAAFSGILLINR